MEAIRMKKELYSYPFEMLEPVYGPKLSAQLLKKRKQMN